MEERNDPVPSSDPSPGEDRGGFWSATGQGAGATAPSGEAARELAQWYRPPFDLTSDLLLAAALCPTAPLRAAFPAVPFLSLFGRTPLLLWFTRVRKIIYSHAGRQGQLGDDEEILYSEMNLVTLLRDRAFFVPYIGATSQLTVAVARHYYGMPKQVALVELDVTARHFNARARVGTRESVVRARLLRSAGPWARLVSRLWPRRLWPARFPDGRAISPLIQATPHLRPALVHEGTVHLGLPQLPLSLSLLPLALYLPGQRMRLPTP